MDAHSGLPCVYVQGKTAYTNKSSTTVADTDTVEAVCMCDRENGSENFPEDGWVRCLVVFIDGKRIGSVEISAMIKRLSIDV